MFSGGKDRKNMENKGYGGVYFCGVVGVRCEMWLVARCGRKEKDSNCRIRY